MKNSKAFVAVIAAASCGVTYAVEINFDELAEAAIINVQYPGVTFSSNANSTNRAYTFATANTPTKILCTYFGDSLSCTRDTNLDFAVPVNGLTFWAIEPNAVGESASIDIFEDGFQTATYSLIGLGGNGNKFVDLSGYSNITRIHITVSPDEMGNQGGIGWDTFRFTPVPEPLSITGLLLGAIGLAKRTKKQQS